VVSARKVRRGRAEVKRPVAGVRTARDGSPPGRAVPGSGRRDGAAWLAGDAPTLADYFLGPILFYVSLTPDAEEVMSVPGVKEWWAAMSAHETFRATEPDLG
jgi:glutathione S-transferase